MQLLIDLLPLVLALVVYQLHGIYAATIALMITLPLIPLGQWVLKKPVSKVHIWSALLMLVFGTATLMLSDTRFVMWKPSILYFAMACVFIGFQFASDKTIIERMLGGSMELAPEHWRSLNMIWAAFFAFLGALNLYVAYQYEEATWFNFKVWGLTGLTFSLIIAQSIWVAIKIENPENTANRASGED